MEVAPRTPREAALHVTMSHDDRKRATVAPTDLVLIRHSGLRVVEAAEVLASLDADLVRLPRLDAHVDTLSFAEQVETGTWDGQVEYLQRSADRVKQLSDSSANPALHYFGLAEIPHVIAFAALLGDERRVHVHEFERDKGTWAWPSGERTLTVDTTGLPVGAAVTSHGTAVVRVSVSASVSDPDVRDVAGDEHLADIDLTVTDGSPAIAKVRSTEDLEQIRLAVRAAIAALASCRPNLDLIHLFVAAPVSVCFAIGQELKARNSVPIQTYRFRTVSGQSRYQPALLIAEGSPQVTPLPPSGEEADKAGRARSGPLTSALDDVLKCAAESTQFGPIAEVSQFDTTVDELPRERLRRFCRHLATHRLRILLVFDNTDRYHFFYSKHSFFDQYYKEQIASIRSNFNRLINSFVNTPACQHP